jgi:fermentation-respiration switch protein FrsA (DUF1100 family)
MRKVILLLGFLIYSFAAMGADMSNGADNFYTSDKVTVQKVRFKNQYQMTVVGNLFVPKKLDRKARHPAIIVGHPFGATKEQTSNLYATKMAEQGFVTLSFDLSFWGESDGLSRNVVLPDVYVEDFSAAADYLSSQSFVDRNRIGVIGVCASGAFSIGAAKVDPRLRAIATVNLLDMGAVARNLNMPTPELRRAGIAEAADQRDVEFSGGKIKYTGGTVHEIDEKTIPLQREFFDFYRTPRGEYTPKGWSKEQTTHPTLASFVKFLNFYPMNDIESISPRPILFIVGEQAISKGFTDTAYKLASQPKELYAVPSAGHVDLYDRVNLIPFGKITAFFKKNL